MVSFNQIPATTLVPAIYVEFSTTRAQQGLSVQPYKILVVGQRTSAGSVAELIPTRVFSAAQAAAYFGDGSLLHRQAIALFANNKVTEATFVAFDDAGGGVAAQGSLTIAGTPTEAGSIAFYVGGKRYEVGVTTASTPTTIAAALTTAVNADTSSPVTAAPTAGVALFTAKNAGSVMNDIDFRHSYAEGEALPAGITVTPAAVTSGTTDPTFANVFPVLSEDQYNVWVWPYTASAGLTALEGELDDRFGPLRANSGFACMAKNDSLANLVTLGDGQNSKHFGILGIDDSPTPDFETGAALAGVVALAAQQDPARPFQTLELAGVLPPIDTNVFTAAEQEQLLADGISVYKVDASGNVRIGRLVSTWQEDPLTSTPSSAFRDANTFFTLDFMRYSLTTRLLQRYPRVKLAQDGTRFGAGQAIVTPQIIRSEIIALAREWEDAGLLEDHAQFSSDLIVEISNADPNRVEIQLSPNLVNGFRVGAAQAAFIS